MICNPESPFKHDRAEPPHTLDSAMEMTKRLIEMHDGLEIPTGDDGWVDIERQRLLIAEIERLRCLVRQRFGVAEKIEEAKP